jgi:Rrf2 family protein
MLSQAAEYSLRAVCCLADHPGQSLTIRQIAALTHAPTGYLAKILARLNRAGLVSGQRGINGGYVMRARPSDLTLLDVVRLADPSHRIEKCPLGPASPCGTNLCALHGRIDSAAAAAETVLQSSTVQDVLNDPRYRRPLREDQAPAALPALAPAAAVPTPNAPPAAPIPLTVITGVCTYDDSVNGR